LPCGPSCDRRIIATPQKWTAREVGTLMDTKLFNVFYKAITSRQWFYPWRPCNRGVTDCTMAIATWPHRSGYLTSISTETRHSYKT